MTEGATKIVDGKAHCGGALSTIGVLKESGIGNYKVHTGSLDRVIQMMVIWHNAQQYYTMALLVNGRIHYWLKAYGNCL